MNNILILNLGTSHDLISSSYLTSAYKLENPSVNIHLITFSAHKDIAEVLKGVTKCYFIDSDLIQSIFQNPLYSNAFAINQFMETLSPLLSQKWDRVINYSNDNISSFLISVFDSTQKIGSYINNHGIAKSSEKWGNYQNSVASKLKRLTIDKTTMRNHMLSLPLSFDSEKFKSHADYSIAAGQNFSRIRQTKGSPGTFVVGINLESAYNGHTVELSTLIDIIEALEESKDFKAVLLLNGKNRQREIATELNKHFNNNLISINIETVALPAVISNLDALLSSPNDQLAIADAMETKCIEIREYEEKNYTPIIINPESSVIYVKEETSLASDILLSLNEDFGTELPLCYLNSKNPIYRSVQDEYGHFFTQVRGELNIQKELRYHIERSFFFQLLGYSKNADLLLHINKNTNRADVIQFVTNLKGELTSTVKTLLATVRSLKSVRNSKSNLNSFIGYLDALMEIGRGDSIVSSVIRNFEGRIENINSTDIDSNIKSIETNLFDLKSELQTLTVIMSELTQEVPAEDKSIESIAPNVM